VVDKWAFEKSALSSFSQYGHTGSSSTSTSLISAIWTMFSDFDQGCGSMRALKWGFMTLTSFAVYGPSGSKLL
jgi:hypothetical protein